MGKQSQLKELDVYRKGMVYPMVMTELYKLYKPDVQENRYNLKLQTLLRVMFRKKWYFIHTVQEFYGIEEGMGLITAMKLFQGNVYNNQVLFKFPGVREVEGYHGLYLDPNQQDEVERLSKIMGL